MKLKDDLDREEANLPASEENIAAERDENEIRIGTTGAQM